MQSNRACSEFATAGHIASAERVGRRSDRAGRFQLGGQARNPFGHVALHSGWRHDNHLPSARIGDDTHLWHLPVAFSQLVRQAVRVDTVGRVALNRLGIPSGSVGLAGGWLSISGLSVRAGRRRVRLTGRIHGSRRGGCSAQWRFLGTRRGRILGRESASAQHIAGRRGRARGRFATLRFVIRGPNRTARAAMGEPKPMTGRAMGTGTGTGSGTAGRLVVAGG